MAAVAAIAATVRLTTAPTNVPSPMAKSVQTGVIHHVINENACGQAADRIHKAEMSIYVRRVLPRRFSSPTFGWTLTNGGPMHLFPNLSLAPMSLVVPFKSGFK